MGKPGAKKTFSKNLKRNFQESISLDKLISTIIRKPGFKTDRDVFLREEFRDSPQEVMESIIREGPVKAGIPREELRQRAEKILHSRISSSDDHDTGQERENNLPTEIIRFYSLALKSAQEIAYLYGERDLWKKGSVDSADVRNQLMLYCAVMLGATGAAKTAKVFASSLAKEAQKKMLTKIFYYPLVKAVAKMAGKNITIKSISDGVSQSIPAAGEFFSNEITLAALFPMGKRLIDALDKAHFDYSEEEFQSDIKEIADKNNIDIKK